MLKLSLDKNKVEAGCDEAGRGCLAGPVCAAAVILPKTFKNKLLNDSKQLNEKKRNDLRIIIEKEAIAYGVAFVDHARIDEINILNASFEAMHLALEQLKIEPESILVDGNRFKPFKKIEHHCIIKGDGKFMSIAAASILAKTYRDEFMEKMHEQHPHYSWNKNKGYPTKDHRLALEEFGPSPIHRMSFQLKKKQLSLDL
ncbi:MAG: ribonuclease HII [Flavobacteriales bacterium]|nr:ribonuclease HII [Flavobacteriales bacterium]